MTKRRNAGSPSPAGRHGRRQLWATAGAGPGGPRRRQGGFALLVSLLAIVGLTALATGGFFLADSERETASNHHAAVEAYHLADAGLHQHLGTLVGPPGVGTTTYDYPDAGGDALVEAERIGTTRDDREVYRVISTGRYRPDGPGRTIVRRVGTVAVLDASVIPDPPSAVASGGGIKQNGSSGTISGVDECGVTAPRAGVRVPTEPGYIQSGGEEVLEGDPPADSVSEPFDFIESGDRWWQGMLDGTAVLHDYTVSSDDSSSRWPDFSGIGGMPVVYVDDDSIELGDVQDGRGLLIVRGDATFEGDFDWDGVVLVGGSITGQGHGRIEGAVMTGLNALIGDGVSRDGLGDVDEIEGRTRYLFDSCIVDQVRDATASLAPVASTWHEDV